MASPTVPDAERLAKSTEEWLRLLREALPEPEEAAPMADAAGLGAAASLVSAGAGGGLPSRGASADGSSPCTAGASAATARTPETARSPGLTRSSAAEEASSLLAAMGLERLFGEPRSGRQEDTAGGASAQGSERGILPEAATASGGGATFRVQVPRQYPGVQYRKSKNLNDRYPRYAKLGTVVTGHVEDDGEWLRISDHVFLPMKVGGVQILEPSLNDALGSATADSGKTLKSLWFACSQGNHGEEQEVVTDLKETN
mmetsp:Transcript_33419/g.77609  ORF Transcript_33419/g.77609 Transcript_33419/m.77609 type:complete len:258 (-) Transcript_33419:226-999(-)